MATQHNITISLPEELWERVQLVASKRQLSIETTIVDVLSLLVGSTDEALETHLSLMETASDEQLWSIAQLSLSDTEQSRLSALIQEGKQANLSVGEERELNQLTEMSEYWMVLRSKALAILKKRGHDIQNFLKHRQ